VRQIDSAGRTAEVPEDPFDDLRLLDGDKGHGDRRAERVLDESSQPRTPVAIDQRGLRTSQTGADGGGGLIFRVTTIGAFIDLLLLRSGDG